jgi:hypothetical protein
MELVDDDGDAAKRTRLDDGVVCREGTPAHTTAEGGSESARSKYCTLCIRDKSARQRPWLTSLTIQGQARSMASATKHQHDWKIGRAGRWEDDTWHDDQNTRQGYHW